MKNTQESIWNKAEKMAHAQVEVSNNALNRLIDNIKTRDEIIEVIVDKIRLNDNDMKKLLKINDEKKEQSQSNVKQEEKIEHLEPIKHVSKEQQEPVITLTEDEQNAKDFLIHTRFLKNKEGKEITDTNKKLYTTKIKRQYNIDKDKAERLVFEVFQ